MKDSEGNDLYPDIYNPMVYSTLISESVTAGGWRTIRTLSLSKGTWIISFGGWLSGTSSAITYRVVDNDGYDNRQSIYCKDNNYYSANGCCVYKASSTITLYLQAWAPQNCTANASNLYACKLNNN